MEPYAAGLVKGSPYVSRRAIEGEILAVLDLALEKRGLRPIAPRSRALTANSIHEIALTDQDRTDEMGAIDRVAYVGFAEIIRGGVAVVEDSVRISNLEVGVLIAFDETHFPNHMNLLVRSKERNTGKELGVCVGDRFSILPRENIQ
jgi:hypothetical protein